MASMTHAAPGAHPRVCGENRQKWDARAKNEGSSPRVRGKLGEVGAQVDALGAHPRACGENCRCPRESGGEPGSSPRVRGKLRRGILGHPRRGLIPARAGKTATRSPGCTHPGAHPRACGENPAAGADAARGHGSSPRVRGKLHRRRRPRHPRGLIPARAGKTGGSVCRSRSPRAHPRACGENVPWGEAAPLAFGSSPRVRGKLRAWSLKDIDARLIPARAGKTRTWGSST